MPDSTFNGVEVLWMLGVLGLAFFAQYAARRAERERIAAEQDTTSRAVPDDPRDRIREAYEGIAAALDASRSGGANGTPSRIRGAR